MQDWNTPLDLGHQLAREILGHLRTDLSHLHDRISTWQLTPMPEDYTPSADEHLHPLSYDQPYPALCGRRLEPHRHGDVVFFYDYCVRTGRRTSSRLYP